MKIKVHEYEYKDPFNRATWGKRDVVDVFDYDNKIIPNTGEFIQWSYRILRVDSVLHSLDTNEIILHATPVDRPAKTK